MPSSYQGKMRRDSQKEVHVSQSTTTNTAADNATVQTLLDEKGGDVFTIRPQETIGAAVKILSEKKIGALIVTDAAGALKGIMSERDIVRKLAETPGQTLPQKVEDIMTSKVETCAPSDPMVTLLSRMTKGRFRHMPVVDGGRLVGMVTIGDVVNHRLTELELEALKLKQMIVG